MDQGSRDVGQQVFEAIGLGVENNDGNPSALQVLLVGDALIHGQQNIESGFFRRREKCTILESGQSSVTGRLAVVPGQEIPQALIDAFIN